MPRQPSTTFGRNSESFPEFPGEETRGRGRGNEKQTTILGCDNSEVAMSTILGDRFSAADIMLGIPSFAKVSQRTAAREDILHGKD